MIRDFMEAVSRDLTPSGALRAAVSYGNSMVTQRGSDGQPCGVAVDLSTELARRMRVPLLLTGYERAADVCAARLNDGWDLAFLVVEPARTQRMDFTAAYTVLESTYLVHDDSGVRTVVDVDRPGMRIAVAEGGFYDLQLSRTLRHAQLMRAPTPVAAVEMFLRDGLDAAAGVRQPLLALSKTQPGLRVLEGRFAAVEQAIALPKGRAAGLRYLNAFLLEAKRAGLVEAGLRSSSEYRLTGNFSRTNGPRPNPESNP